MDSSGTVCDPQSFIRILDLDYQVSRISPEFSESDPARSTRVEISVSITDETGPISSVGQSVPTRRTKEGENVYWVHPQTRYSVKK